MLLISAAVACAVFAPATASAEQKLRQIPVLVHISSTISDGKYSLREITSIAQKNGFDAVIVTDRDYMRWEYGVWPLRNIIKKTVENNSIHTFGLRKYFDAAAAAQAENPEVILIPGMEITPFYYWSGSFLKGTLALYSAHKHMLVIGLQNMRDVAGLPVTANRFSEYRPFRFIDTWRLWPVVLFLAGIILLKGKKRLAYRNSLERDAARGKFRLGACCVIIGTLFSVNDYPFREALFDQYHGDRGEAPYQALIDYVDARNGLVFWAHPEAENSSSVGRTAVVTRPHVQDVVTTRNYSGFCVWYEGYSVIGKPGGVWDNLLNEYREGKRTRPVWAIAGLAFDYYGDLNKLCNDLRVVALARANTQADIIDALRQGRVYVMRGNASRSFVLDNFIVGNETNDAVMGETLALGTEHPTITIQGHFSEPVASFPVTLRLLRNGKIIKTFERVSPVAIEYADKDYPGGKTYYRLEITAPGLQLITNPIFVKK
ncbi:MAG: hypothetical protein PHO30_00585 [Candidatus Omnitrophica bacterium]|nr:hypothetical protein [Candidatus Omnitrophota bacterium]